MNFPGSFRTASARPMVWLFALMLFISGPVVADEGDPIIVSAPSRSEGTLKQQVSQFSRQVADITGQEQFARRGSTYCPRIIGLPDPYHRIILTKLEHAAKATRKVRAGPAGCQPDLFVIFTSDSAGLLKQIQLGNPGFVRRLQSDAKARQLHARAPVKWWYDTALIGADWEPVIDGATYRTNASLISSGIAITLASIVVIVDVGLSDGYPLDSIASYVAMIAFAQIQVSAGRLAKAPSILGIFDRVSPRLDALRELTVWDRAYLRALYRIPPDRPLWRQRARLNAAMVEAIMEAERADQ